MGKRLVTLIICLILAIAAFPLLILAFNPDGDAVLSEQPLPLYVKSGEMRDEGEPKHVPEEVLVKFVHGAGESEIASLKAGNGMEKAYV